MQKKQSFNLIFNRGITNFLFIYYQGTGPLTIEFYQQFFNKRKGVFIFHAETSVGRMVPIQRYDHYVEHNNRDLQDSDKITPSMIPNLVNNFHTELEDEYGYAQLALIDNADTSFRF